MKNVSSSIPEIEGARNLGAWIKRFLQSGLLSESERYISWLSYFDSEMKQKLYKNELKEAIKNAAANSLHMDCFNRVSALDYLERISYLDLNTYLVDDLLIMGDRMSMAHALELRVPFCDHRLMEFCATIPGSLKLKNLRLKAMSKRAFKGFLPKKVIYKKKQGFMVPIGKWMRQELKEYISDTLSKSEIEKAGYFNYDFISYMLESHCSGKRIFTHQIWALLVFSLWYRMFMEDGKS
jgi:asparagine synthase (glutamine-hydrolysing)